MSSITTADTMHNKVTAWDPFHFPPKPRESPAATGVCPLTMRPPKILKVVLQDPDNFLAQCQMVIIF